MYLTKIIINDVKCFVENVNYVLLKMSHAGAVIIEFDIFSKAILTFGTKQPMEY